MPEPRWWTGVALALLASGCSSPPATPRAAPDSPPVIEASQASDRGAGPQPIGEGDPQAQRCLASGAEAAPDTPCGEGAASACAAQCRAGDPSACRSFASDLPESERACRLKLWRLACERDELAACTDLATTEGLEDAAALAERACKGRYPRGCRVWGELAKTDSVAVARFDEACELGDAEGCVAAAQKHSGGDGVDHDRRKAAEQLKRACDLGHLEACVDLALAHVSGGAIPHDPDRARQLLEQICSLDGEGDGGRSCFILASLSAKLFHRSGTAPPVDQILDRSCDKGFLDACESVAHTHYAAGRFERAIEVATKAIAERPSSWALRYARGLSRFNLGQFGEAAEDLEVLCPLRSDLPYCPLWLYAARERAGEDGEPGLDQHLADLGSTDWPEPIFRYFLGRLSEQRLLRDAREPDDARRQLEKQCEAYYYIAQRLFIEGRDKRAITMLHKTVDTGITNFIEYSGAEAELKRLGIAR